MLFIKTEVELYGLYLVKKDVLLRNGKTVTPGNAFYILNE